MSFSYPVYQVTRCLRHADITILQLKADVTFISLQNCVDTDLYIFCNIVAIIQTLRLFTWQRGKQVSWVCNNFYSSSLCYFCVLTLDITSLMLHIDFTVLVLCSALDMAEQRTEC